MNALSKNVVICALFLSGCGGSSDDGAGGPVALNASPATFTLSAPASSGCPTPPATSNVQVFINGGTAPYTIYNPAPGWLAVSTTTVSSRGGSFTVSFLGGCIEWTGDNSGILVTDKLGKQIYVAINYKEGT